jgi:hypothetical protein
VEHVGREYQIIDDGSVVTGIGEPLVNRLGVKPRGILRYRL